MPSIMLSAAQTCPHLIIIYPYEVENLIPIGAIRKLTLREAKSLASGLVSSQVQLNLMIKPWLSLIFHAGHLGSDRKEMGDLIEFVCLWFFYL